MTYLVFADEQKKVAGHWDYHALVFISVEKAKRVYTFLQSLRDKYNFHGEIKFTGINKKGTGTTFQIIQDILSFIYHESRSTCEPSLLFAITGIDRDKLNFSFFGDGAYPSGKYATIYNRFFCSSLKGAITLFFQERTCLEISHIVHDTEGNLENHGYFNWHVIKKASASNKHIRFKGDSVLFVHSDHRREKHFPKCSHMIQVVDVLLGSITHCIHYENNKNIGKTKAATIIAPLVEEILNPVPKGCGHHETYRRYTISHFPKNKIQEFNGEIIPGEFYRIKTVQLLEAQRKQMELFPE